MRFWFSGPRLFGGYIRPGVSFGPGDFRRRAAPQPTAGIAPDFVYVIEGDHGLVKVGYSSNPAARLAALRTASPFPLELILQVPMPRAFEVEQEAHRILAMHRAEGEWFEVDKEMAIAAVFGAASRLGVSFGEPEPDLAPEPESLPRPILWLVGLSAAFYAAIIVWRAFS